MQQIDHVEWADKLTLRCYGVRFAIRVNSLSSLSALPLLQLYLPPGCSSSSSAEEDRLYSICLASDDRGEHSSNVLYANSTMLAESGRLDDVLSAFESDLQYYIAETSPGHIFIHSGVVGWKGKAILIPGYSFSGKTTLVSELVQAGATYYSDEYAVIDQDGLVRSYARPLKIRDGASGRTTKCPVEVLGGVHGVTPIPVGLVCLSQYKPGVTWRPRQIPAGQGFLELLRHTATARRRPQASVSALQTVAKHSAFLKGSRSEARDMAKSLLQ